MGGGGGVFGIIAELPPDEATLTFVTFLIVLVFLEWLLNSIEKIAFDMGVLKLYEKLQKELMNMGILSFIAFVLLNSGQYLSPSLVEAFDMAHIVVFFMGIAFIIQAIFLVFYGSFAGRRYINFTRTASDILIQKYEALLFDVRRNWWFHKGSSLLPAFPSFRNAVEFRIIERLFVNQYKLPKEFEFAQYVTALFKVCNKRKICF